MNLKTIIDKFIELDIDFTLLEHVEIDTEMQFQPASLKQIIPNGIFFISNGSTSLIEGISKSVIISDKKLNSANHEIIVENPQLSHYKLTQFFVKPPTKGIHPTAIISEHALIGKDVTIGPYSVLGECIIGDNVTIKNHVVIEDHVTIKANCFIDSNSVIGAGGLAWIWDEQGKRIMQPQLGGVVIEENCLLATDVTVVKGSLSENTLIGAFTVIAHGTKIGHGSQIGNNVHMANNVSLAGNAEIGNFSFLGSGCVVSSNITIPKNTIVGAAGLVNKNFEEEFLTLAGVPAQIIKRNNFESKPTGAPKPFKK